MADLEKTIQIIFLGDDRIGKTITGIAKNLDGLAGRAETATQPLADLAASAVKLEAALGALVVGGLVAAFNASSDFENAMVELRKVVGEQPAALEAARKEAFLLSDQFGESASEILLSTADFVQAGFDVEGAMKLTRSALDLVIAGNLDASQASEILIASLKGFKAPAEEAARITDLLNEVSNNYATNIEELGIGLAELSPIAKTAGLTFEETVGILTPVIEVFRSGSEAANALKTGLLKLVDDNATVVAALDLIGVSQTDANGALRSAKEILFDVSAAFQDLDQNQKLYITQQLVGINQAGRLVEVFDNLGKSTEVTATAMNAAGSAAKEVAARLASSEVSVNRFKTAFVNLGIAIGDEFRVAAQGAIDGGTDIENALAGIIKAGTFEPVFAEIRDFSAQLGETLSGIADALPDAFALVDWEPLLASIRDLETEVKETFQAFFGEIDLTTPEGLSNAIQKIVDSGAGLTRVVAGILDQWQPFIKILSDSIDRFNDLDGKQQKAIGQFLGLGQIVNKIAGNIGKLTAGLESIGKGLLALSVTNIPGALKSLGQLGSAIGLGGIAGGGVIASITLLAGAFALIPDTKLREFAEATIPGFKNFATAVDETVLKLRGFPIEAIKAKEAQAQLTQELGDAAVEIVRALESIDEIPDEVTTEVLIEGTDEYDEALQKILDDIKELPESKTTEVKAELDTVGFQEAFDFVIETAEDGVTTIVSAKANKPSFEETKQEIEKIPPEKELEITVKAETEKEIAKIEAQAETLEAAFKYQAEVDIAEIQAATDAIIALSGDISDMFAASGELILGLASGLGDLSASEFLDVSRWIEEENRRRDELLRIQTDLSQAEIEFLNAKRKQLESGGGIVTIRGENLEPELQLVLSRIIELTQIEANEQGLEFLIGI